MDFIVERIQIDNRLNRLLSNANESLWDSFLDVVALKGLVLEDKRTFFIADEMQFLEFIGHGKILKESHLKLLPLIKRQIFDFFESEESIDNENVNKVIDDLFNQCLEDCKTIKELIPNKLAAKHKDNFSKLKGKGASFIDQAVAGSLLDAHKRTPQNSFSHIHLSLAWNLLTAILRPVFNEISTKKHPDVIIKFFEALVASVHHCTFDNRIQLNLFRVVETAYLSISRHLNYEKKLNQEDLTKLKDYCKNYQTKTKSDLGDCAYLDRALLGFIDMDTSTQLPATVLTMDNPKVALNRLQLFRLMLEPLQSKVESWRLSPVYSCKVICLDETGGRFNCIDTIQHAICLPQLLPPSRSLQPPSSKNGKI